MEQIHTETVQDLPRFNAGIVVQVLSLDGKLKFFAPLLEADGNRLVIDRLPGIFRMGSMNISFEEQCRYFGFQHRLLVSSIDRGIVYCCQAKVDEATEQRASLTLFGKAREILRQYQRRDHRFDCELPTYLHGHQVAADCRMENISSHGCQLSVGDEQVLQEIRQCQSGNASLSFEVRFPHADSFHCLHGKVVNVGSYDEDERHQIGVEFSAGNEAVNEYINFLRLE